MIPIVSICNLATLPFFIFILFRLYFSFKGTNDKNIGYFFVAFFAMAIVEGLLATPGLLLKDLIKIDTVFAIYPFFLFLCLGSLAAIPFHILKWETAGKFFFICFILITLFVTAIDIINIKEAVVYKSQPFIYWEDTRGVPINTLIGIITGLILSSIAFFFFLNGLKSAEKYVRTRSLIIGSGIGMFLLAGIANFIFGSMGQEYKNIISLITVFILILSSMIMFIGVNYKIKESIKGNSGLETKNDSPKIQW